MRGCHCERNVIAATSKSTLNQDESQLDRKGRRTPHYVAACEAQDQRTAPDAVAGSGGSVMPASVD